MSSNIRTSSGAALARRQRYFAHDSILNGLDDGNVGGNEYLLPPKEDPRRHRRVAATQQPSTNTTNAASIYDQYEASIANPQPQLPTYHTHRRADGMYNDPHNDNTVSSRHGDSDYGIVGFDPYTRSDTASVREPSFRSGSLDAKAAHSINSTSAVPIWTGAAAAVPPSAAIVKRGTQQHMPSADTPAVSTRHRRHNQRPPPRAAPVILTYPTAIELRRQVQKMVSNAAASYFTDVEREYSQVERLHRQHHHATHQRELVASNGQQASLPMYIPPPCEIVLRTVFTIDPVSKAPVLQRAAPMSIDDIPHALSSQLEGMCRQCINPPNLEARKRAREVLAISHGTESSSMALKQMYKNRNNSNSREGSTSTGVPSLLDLSPEKPPPPGSEYKREFAVWVTVQGALVTPLAEGEILRGFPGEEQYWEFGQSSDWGENEDGRHVVLFHSFMVVDGAEDSDEPVWERDSASPHRGPPPSVGVHSLERFETPMENPTSQRNSLQVSYAEIEEQVRKRQEESDTIASEREAEEVKARKARGPLVTPSTTPSAPALPTIDLNTQAGKMLKGAESILKQLRQLYFIPAQEILASSSSSPNGKNSSKRKHDTTATSPPKVRLSQQGVLQGLLDFSILCQKAATSLHGDIQLSEKRIEGISSNTNAALQDFISRAQQEAQDKIRHSEEEAAKQKAIFDQRGTEIQEEDAFDTENDAIVALMNELATTKARLAEFEAETNDIMALRERLLEKERAMEREERLRRMRQRDSYTQYGDNSDEDEPLQYSIQPGHLTSSNTELIHVEEAINNTLPSDNTWGDGIGMTARPETKEIETDTTDLELLFGAATPPLQYVEVVSTNVISKAVSNAAQYFQAEYLRDTSTSPMPSPPLVDSVTMTTVPTTTCFAAQIIDGLDDSDWHPKEEVVTDGVAVEVQTEESWEDAMDMVYAQAALDLERQLEEDRLSPLTTRSPPQRRTGSSGNHSDTTTAPRGLPPLSPRGGGSGVSPPRRPNINPNITEEEFNGGITINTDGEGDRRRKSLFNPPRHLGVENPVLAEYKDEGTLTVVPPPTASTSSNTESTPLSTIAVQTQIRADAMDAIIWSAIQGGSVPPEILDVHHPKANRSGSPLPYHHTSQQQYQPRSSISPPVADSLPSSSAPSSPVMVSVSAKTSASPSHNPRAPSFEEQQQDYQSGAGPRMFSEDVPDSPFSIHRGSPYHQQFQQPQSTQPASRSTATHPHEAPQLVSRLIGSGGGDFDGYDDEDAHMVPFADRIQAILDAEERAAEEGRSREYYLGETVASQLSEAELKEIERQREKRRRLHLQSKERRAKSTERQADRRRKEREETRREEDRRLMNIRLEYQRQLDEETERRRLASAAGSRGVSESTDDIDNASSSGPTADSTSEEDMPVVSQGGEPSAQTTRIYLDGVLGEEIYNTLHYNHQHGHGNRSVSASSSKHQSPQAAGPFRHSRQRSPEGATATSRRPQYRSQHQLVPPPPISSVRVLVGEQRERVDYQQRQRDQTKVGNLWYTPKSASTSLSEDPAALKNAIEGLFQGRQLSPPSTSAQPRKSSM